MPGAKEMEPPRYSRLRPDVSSQGRSRTLLSRGPEESAGKRICSGVRTTITAVAKERPELIARTAGTNTLGCGSPQTRRYGLSAIGGRCRSALAAAPAGVMIRTGLARNAHAAAD